jgi:hypothetical protein
LEFKLMNPAQEQDLSKMMIQFNNEQLKKEISEAVKKYQGITYGEDKIAEAKADRAALNKFKEALEDRRKAVKKEYLKPYEAFEAQVKELVAFVDQPIAMIDSQIKEYEEGAKQLKREEISDYYVAVADKHKLRDLLPLRIIWNERWLNTTYKMKDIKAEIAATFEKVVNDLAVIKELKTEFELQVQDRYLQDLNLSAALKENTRLIEAKQRKEAYEASIKQGEAPAPPPAAQQTIIDVECKPVEQETELKQQIDLRFWLTTSQKQKLKQFCLDNGIRYAAVPK